MKKLFKTIKPYLKWLFPIAIILIVLYLLSGKIIKFFSGDNYFQSLSSFGSTISDFDAQQIADGLHVAMGSTGTEFSDVKRLLKGLSEKDYIKVYNKFETRGYIDILGVGTDLFGALQLNLTQWLHSELSDSEQSQIKLQNPYLF